jgi:hypothetical protein
MNIKITTPKGFSMSGEVDPDNEIIDMIKFLLSYDSKQKEFKINIEEHIK